MAQFSVNTERFDPYKNFKFRVKWDGRYVAGISKVSGLSRTTQVVSHREGGAPSSTRKSPGQTDYEAVTLERGVTHDIEEAYSGAAVVYAKSWGALPYYGRPEEEYELRKNYRHFIVNEEKMALTNNGLFSHCLPLRRNVKATDGVMDAPYCLAMARVA